MRLCNSSLTYLFAFALFASLITGQTGTAAEEAGNIEGIYGDTPCIEGAQSEDPVLQRFRTHYKAFMMTADESQSTAEQKKRAYDLWVSLQHKLVDQDAELFLLRVKIKQSSGAEQERAISNLTKLAAERKQIIMEHFDALVRINNNGSKSEAMIPDAKNTRKSEDSVTSESNIEIKIELGDPHLQDIE